MLVQATGQSDLEAFNQIVKRYQTWAWRVAYGFIANEEDALDIVQEAFLRLLDGSGRYRPTAKFRTYFYQIITDLCLDQAKKPAIAYPNDSGCPDSSPNVTDAMIRQEAAIVIRAALDGLPHSQRVTIVQRDYGDLNYPKFVTFRGQKAAFLQALTSKYLPSLSWVPESVKSG